jgi:hypothetical protein
MKSGALRARHDDFIRRELAESARVRTRAKARIRGVALKRRRPPRRRCHGSASLPK